MQVEVDFAVRAMQCSDRKQQLSAIAGVGT